MPSRWWTAAFLARSDTDNNTVASNSSNGRDPLMASSDSFGQSFARPGQQRLSMDAGPSAANGNVGPDAQHVGTWGERQTNFQVPPSHHENGDVLGTKEDKQAASKSKVILDGTRLSWHTDKLVHSLS
eukprot:scaffold398268_cov50-Prasinocladus_malaysianus.AAC.1